MATLKLRVIIALTAVPTMKTGLCRNARGLPKLRDCTVPTLALSRSGKRGRFEMSKPLSLACPSSPNICLFSCGFRIAYDTAQVNVWSLSAVRDGIATKGSKGHRGIGCIPSPNPLPKGEGVFRPPRPTPLDSRFHRNDERETLRVLRVWGLSPRIGMVHRRKRSRSVRGASRLRVCDGNWRPGTCLRRCPARKLKMRSPLPVRLRIFCCSTVLLHMGLSFQ